MTELQKSDVKNYQGVPCLVDPSLVGHFEVAAFEAIHIATDIVTDVRTVVDVDIEPGKRFLVSPDCLIFEL